MMWAKKRLDRCAAVLGAVLSGTVCGCSTNVPPATGPTRQQIVQASNSQFLTQRSYDPWLLTNSDPGCKIPAYVTRGGVGYLIGPDGQPQFKVSGDHYVNNNYVSTPANKVADSIPPVGSGGAYSQVLDLKNGMLTTTTSAGRCLFHASGPDQDWPTFWRQSDLEVTGDPQAQQVVHANLFYVVSSLFSTNDRSVAPMGLSSVSYGGHIFWDAELWVLPAIIVQHPDLARSIVDYRFQRIAQAAKNAEAHGYSGAEYPWESAETGEEVAPAEFSRERHITADVAFAAWQYYLWTGDRDYLLNEALPILRETADYWVSRANLGSDGKYHIKQVISPDEIAGLVDDDVYTNCVVRCNLIASVNACRELGLAGNPRWTRVADSLYLPHDKMLGIPAENANPLTSRTQAKQADALLILFPLDQAVSPSVQGKMLDYYSSHTIKNGPAMTTCIESVIASRLGRGSQSLTEFRDSYQPFMRAPWDAFSEKRSTDNIYFLTGMAGSLQSVLYGFAGLHIVYGSEQASGKLIAKDGNVSLFADPHLPPGWSGLVVHGIQFHRKVLTLAVGPGNAIKISDQSHN